MTFAETPDWVVRVASHPRHGGGHLARSSVLARALMDAGATVLVVLDEGAESAARKLEERGLSIGFRDDPGPPPRFGCVLDGYDILRDETGDWRARSPFLAVMDDFLAPPEGADVVINGAIHLAGSRVNGTPALLGPDYAIVDPRYAKLPDRDRTAKVSDVLVTFGRLDPDNVTGLVLEAIEALAADLRVTVVAASAWRHLPDIRRRIAAFGEQGRLVLDASDMVPFLAAADLVVGAGGVSLMERMAAGVPSVTVSIIDNQDVFVEGAARLDATISGGRSADLTVPRMRQALSMALNDPGVRERVAMNGRRIVDGAGASRIAACLLGSARGTGGACGV